MLMDSFEVENFRGLKHFKLEKLARINLLMGKNNSGKTSVLEAFTALVGIGGEWWLSVAEKERGLEFNKSDFRYLFYGFNYENTIGIEAKYQYSKKRNSNKFFKFKISINPLARQTNISTKEPDENSGKRSASNRRNILDSGLSVSVSLSNVKKPINWDVTRGNNDYHFLPATEEGEEFLEFGISDNEFNRHNSAEIITTIIDRETLSRKIDFLKFNKKDINLIDIMQRIDKRIKAIELGAGGQVYLDLGDNFRTLLPLNLMGEGIQRLLDVASAIAYIEGGIVLIDEIDNGLHYSALRILWQGILKAARDYDVQVFATTHSAEALRHLTWVLNEEENAKYHDDVAAYTLIRAEDDTVRSYRYGYSELDFALEHGVEVRN